MLSVEQARFIFHARSHVLNLTSNYSIKFIQSSNFCQVCLDPSKPESQEHLYSCSVLRNSCELVNNNLCYSDLFNNADVWKQYTVGRILKSNYEKRT